MTLIPIACTLSPTDGASQALEWRDLQQRATSTEPIPGGVAATFSRDLQSLVTDLAAREARCCGFLALTVTSAGEEIRLEVTSDHPDAGPIIEMLVGTAR